MSVAAQMADMPRAFGAATLDQVISESPGAVFLMVGIRLLFAADLT